MKVVVRPATPVLRMFDLAATLRFYVDYLGCVVDWSDGNQPGPTYMQVSRGDLVLHLSSHHGDGTPGSVVLVEVDDAAALQAELNDRNYPFMNPGLEESKVGRDVVVIDPASNEIRFFERRTAEDRS